MAGKHRKEKIVHAPTRRQISKWEKQKRQSRIILIIAGILVVAVIGIILAGVYMEQIMPVQKTVIKVNNVSFDYDYYVKTLDILTKNIPKDKISYYTDMTAQAISQSELVRQKGPEIGLSASDDDIKEEMEKDNLPQNRVGTDLALTRVLTKKYTDQICLSKQPASVQAAEVEAMFLESKALVEDRKHKLELGENFTKMAGQLSMEPITKATSGYLGWIPEGYANYVLADLQSASFVDVVFRLQPGAFSDAIYDAGIEKEYGFWVLELLGKDDAKGYHGRGILLPTEQQAQEIREKLIDGGDWDELAKQYSQASGKDAGADLGWILPGSESTMMARLLAAQEPNKISAVLRDETASTSGGYWLVHVIDVEDRPLPSKISQEAAQDCLGEWVVGLQKDATIENLLDQQQKDLAAEKISKTRSK